MAESCSSSKAARSTSSNIKGSGSTLKNIDGNTPLHLAALNGHADAIKIMLKLKIDLEEVNNRGETPLMLAVASGNVEAVQYLLEEGADLTHETYNGSSIWHAAAAVGNAGILRLLTEFSSSTKLEEVKDSTVPSPASDTKCVENISEKERSGESLNCVVDKKLNMNFVKKSIHEKTYQAPMKVTGVITGDIETREEYVWEKVYKQAEMISSDSEDEEFVPELDLPYINYYRTYEDEKEDERKIEVIRKKFNETLLFYFDNKDHNGFTYLHHAVAFGAEKAAKMIIKRKADLNVAGIRGITPILFAAAGGSLPIVSELITAGANYKTADDRGRTVLHIAANRGHVALVQKFLSLGVDPNNKCHDGNTSLHFAAAGNHSKCVEVCKLLLQNGADPREVNIFGNLAFHVALSMRNEKLARILSVPE